tara:strand:- start:162 stop:926 length:765 start_codon:yes stop_codon:yes gene_type:complete
MAFKQSPFPMHKGTSSHSSALKMKESALKYEKNVEDFKKRKEAEKNQKKYDYKVPGSSPGDTVTKHGTKTYKTAYTEKTKKGEATRKKYATQADFVADAEKWWSSEAGQKYAKSNKKFAHRIKKTDAKPDAKTTSVKRTPGKGETIRKSDQKVVVKGLGAQKGKTLTPEQKTEEKAKIKQLKTNVKEAKGNIKSADTKTEKTKQKNLRDKSQQEIGEIRSGRDNKKTGTVVSRFFGKLKAKRNKRQLERRAKKG